MMPAPAVTIKRITRREYLRALLDQPAEWVRASMALPSDGMKKRPVLIALHGVALRRMEKSKDRARMGGRLPVICLDVQSHVHAWNTRAPN